MSGPDFTRTFVLPEGMTNEAFYKEQAEYWREIAGDLQSQLVNVKAAIQRYLDGDFGRDKHFKTKHDTCPHRQFQWQGCEPCIDDYFKQVLASHLDEKRCDCLPWPDKCPYCGGQPTNEMRK